VLSEIMGECKVFFEIRIQLSVKHEQS
jgi:hypothetical protein